MAVDRKPKEIAQTVLVLIAFCLLVAIYSDVLVWLYGALALAAGTLLYWPFAIIVDRLWMGLAKILSLFIPKILLSVIFFVVLFPLAFLRKVFSRNIDLFASKSQSSNFILHEKTYSPESFANPW